MERDRDRIRLSSRADATWIVRLRKLEEAASSIGEGVLCVQADVTKLDDIDRPFQRGVARFGRVDVLFVNAGIGRFAPLAETYEELCPSLGGREEEGPGATSEKGVYVVYAPLHQLRVADLGDEPCLEPDPR